jgi:two-component system sensor histidine kinase KdpD
MTARGRHRVYLGMAPGVGKTYQMLDEGHEESGRGRDVVIGYLEAHGRAETLAQAEGLEVVPRRQLAYHGALLEEMDLPAIVRRRPHLCLVDELAHTNVPGAGHDKRWQDVDAILAAGIDVFSTVNVQHVDSLASRVTALTGIAVHETVPYGVLDAADDVVLVDVPPELVIERLLAGKIYPDQPTDVAQRGFFRREILATLRELALLHVAEEAEPGRRMSPAGVVHTRRRPAPVAAQTGGRVLALATPDARSRPVIHHAQLAAAGRGAKLDVLWVRPESEQARAADELAALERLVQALGGTLLVRAGAAGRIVATIAGVAQERGAGYVVIGQPRTRTPVGLLAHRPLPLELMHALPGVDVQIVALPD